MKTSVEVPSKIIGAFTEKLAELELKNSIKGQNVYDEFEVEINYSKEEAPQVEEAEEYLENLIDKMQNGQEQDGNIQQADLEQ